MVLIEEMYKDDNITADCKSIEKYMDNYNKTKELHYICEFNIYLGCGNSQWMMLFNICTCIINSPRNYE